MKEILVVGAGFTGAVIARELAENGYLVTVVDSRPHIGGNAHDHVNEYGIRIHDYGPHLFHTNNDKVVKWLSRFTEWVDYKHEVTAYLSDKDMYVVLPPNKDTVAEVGLENVVDIFFRPYTRKMWGMEIEELNPSILSRVPVRDDDNTFYFPDDKFQALPRDGYTKMFEEILDHENIVVHLNLKYTSEMSVSQDHVFNCMPIDEYFNYCYGELPYRSIKFDTFNLHSDEFPEFLPTPVVNYTDNEPQTRITQWSLFPNSANSLDKMETFTVETPCDYKENNMERFYPVQDVKGINRELYKKYKAIVPHYMTFVGRCGNYAYINMDQAVSSALAAAKRYVCTDKQE